MISAAALFAYLIASELLGLKAWIGGALIVMGMISAEVPWIKIFRPARISKE